MFGDDLSKIIATLFDETGDVQKVKNEADAERANVCM